MSRKENDQVEERLMAHYIAARGISRLDHVTHLRVGQPRGFSRLNPAPEKERNFLLSELKEADLVVRTKTSATIYEFAVWHPLNKISQLEGYRLLLTETPNYMDLEPTDIRLQLVTALDDNVAGKVAIGKGIAYEVFQDPETLQKIADRRGG